MEAANHTSATIDVTAPGEVRVRRALLSVSDKRGIVEFGRGLAELGVELISTGGTAVALRQGGLDVRSIDDFTGFPEIMDGRVKTLHPRLYAGLLCRRDDPQHLREAAEQGIEFVDLVCVNLYPFERTSARRGVSDEEVVEQIDIGGPTMIRAAAKNFPFAVVVARPESYDAVIDELRSSDGRLSLGTREHLAADAFTVTARYDAAISRWYAERGDDFPGAFSRAYEKVLDLSYGENPHQRAAYYSQVGARMHLLSMVRQHAGKPLSFNNLLDLDSARRMVKEFEVPACAIVKHNNPCGVAIGRNALDAYQRAFACDPMSAFGGVIAVNRPLDRQATEAIAGQFVEVLIAPGYEAEALEAFAAKPNARLLEDGERRTLPASDHELRQVMGGMLVQDRDLAQFDEREQMEVVTQRKPTEAEWSEMLFSWRVCKHVRSNAIVLTRELATVGIGAGQMSRVDSVRLAIEKAQSSLDGAAMASDAFFPFADGPELAMEAGVRTIIQPGGSKRDGDVIEAADRAGVAMVFTSRRHFRH